MAICRFFHSITVWPLVNKQALTIYGSSFLFIFSFQAWGAELTLPQALDKALEHNLTLKSYPYYVRGLEAKRYNSALNPATTVKASLENVAGTGPFQGVDEAEFSLVFSRSIELGDKRKRRVAVVDAQLNEQLQKYEQAKLDVLAKTGRLFYRTVYQQNLLLWRQNVIAEQSESLRQIKRLAQAGAVAEADLMQMQLRLSQSRQAFKNDVANKQYFAQQLIDMWQGSEVSATFDALGSMEKFMPVPTQNQLRDAAKNAPTLLLQQAETRVAQANWELAKTQKKVDLEVGMGVRRFQSNSSNALVFEVSAPLFQARRSQGDIAAAKNTFELTNLQHSIDQQQLLQGLTLLVMQLSHSLAQIEALNGEVIPKAQSYLRVSEAAYKRGQYSLLQWLDAQQTLAQQKYQRIAQQHQIYALMLELERLGGQSFFTVNDAAQTQRALENNDENK